MDEHAKLFLFYRNGFFSFFPRDRRNFHIIPVVYTGEQAIALVNDEEGILSEEASE